MAGESEVDFDTEIVPVFTKAGCNIGSCHGAAIGRGGLRLSLYGTNPELDFRSIVQELEGRRVNIASPEKSLLFLKPTESMAHEGGFKFDDDSPSAQRIVDWIRAGALRKSEVKVKSFAVSPQDSVLEKVGQQVQLKASVTFTNGRTEDVTSWTVFGSDDDSGLDIDPLTAVVTVKRRGVHSVMARFLDRVIPVEITLPLSSEKVDLSSSPKRNFIDHFIDDKLETLGVPVSARTDDHAFLRRLSLDLTGRLPSKSDLESFATDVNPDKRNLKIEELLSSDEFNQFWTFRFSKLLRIRPSPQDTIGAETYYSWLNRQIVDNTPYDQFASQLLTSTGDTHVNGPANFYRTTGDVRAQTEFVTEFLMGVRLKCANCHDHPLDQWTQDDYHGLSAIFAKVRTGKEISVNLKGDVKNPRTRESAIPKIPGQQYLPIDGGDQRAEFTRWLTRADNPYFARAAVNRLWNWLMGRGLIHPTDDIRVTNPPSHPKLLVALTQDFVEQGYDLRHTIRTICQSETYQRSSQATLENQADERFYSHALHRPLEAEVLADAVSDATGVADRYGEFELGTRAVSLINPETESRTLDVLGRCTLEESCESLSQGTTGLSVKLHMINGNFLNTKITNPKGFLHQTLLKHSGNAAVISELFLSCLSRKPTETELRFWVEKFASAQTEKERTALAEDFTWSLLSCREFITNH